MEWTLTSIQFLYDDELVYIYSTTVRNYENWSFIMTFFLILNLKIGSDFGGSIDTDLEFPREYFIDYVQFINR